MNRRDLLRHFVGGGAVLGFSPYAMGIVDFDGSGFRPTQLGGELAYESVLYTYGRIVQPTSDFAVGEEEFGRRLDRELRGLRRDWLKAYRERIARGCHPELDTVTRIPREQAKLFGALHLEPQIAAAREGVKLVCAAG